MSGKKISAPPRPPAPKVGLDKFRSKPSSASTSLSIRFKSLEEDDDEELSVLDSNKNENVKSHSSPASGSEARKLARLHAASKSLDDDRLYNPGHRVTDGREEKRTLFAGIKDKLSDKFPDTIHAITKKWEELSGESSSPSPENEGLEALNHAHPGEVTPAKTERSTLSSSFSSPNIGQLPQSVVKVKGVDSVVVKEDGVDGECSSPARARVPSIAEEEKDSTQDGIEIVDDFYCEEAFEDFNGSVNHNATERVAPETGLRQRSPIQRLIKNKGLSESPSTPMSMSSLLMKNVSEESPESVEYDGNVFFDPNDDNNKASSSVPEGTVLNSEAANHNETVGSAKDSDSKIPIQKLGLYTVALFVYLILPLPSFLSGVLCGMVLASIGWTVYLWITKPPQPREPIKIEPLEDLPPMMIPEMKDLRPDDGKYKGWMNELLYYDSNNYHINQTHSVFVRLEGCLLRLSRPKVGVPKRAMWDEAHTSPQFVHQRYLDLDGSRLFLLPPGLVEKRLWSKKYPLCIALAKPGNKSQSKQGSDSSYPLEEEAVGGAAKEVSGFEVVTEQACESSVLYLFARTNREKEEWYYRLLGATRGKPLPNHLLEVRKALEFKPKHHRSNSDQPPRHKRNLSNDSTGSIPPEELNNRDDPPRQTADIGTFAQYMARLMPAERATKATSPTHTKKDGVKDGKEGVKEWKAYAGSISCEPQLVWLNALLGRCFWDFLLQNYWKDKIQEKLEKKLSKIHVPYFMEELKVTDIDLGSEMPVIRRPSKPYLDERGFWVDLEVAYSGGFRMTIETKLNLMRLKEKSKPKVEVDTKSDRKRSAVTDSEEEDSAESSTDDEGEETPTTTGDDSGTQGGAGKKLLKYIDKITQSKYFQSATEIKYIKKAMVGVSNTRLILTVELHSLVGTLAINIPPPPSDRLWYGFRGNPRLWLVAKPKVGEREVTVTHVTEWIEKKLAIEFQRVFVMPNMDDLVIPLMMSGMSADSMPPIPSNTNSTEI